MKNIHLDAVLFKALCNITKGVTHYGFRGVDSIYKLATIDPNNNLKLYDFDIGYVGEFFERAEERGIVITDTRFATMALFYGLWKNEFAEADFNDYQITEFLEKLDVRATTIDTPIMAYAMYLIKEDAMYLDKITNNADIEDFFIIASCAKNLQSDKTLTVDIIKRMQYLLETKDMVNGDNYYYFQEILEIAHSIASYIEKSKELKTINTYLKGIDGKLTQKGVIKTLSEFGFSASNIEALNCLLKLQICESPLKRQKQIVSFLLYARDMEQDFDEFEKSIIEKIMAVGEFSVKMESGAVRSISNALSYYDILDKVKNTNNFIYLANAAIENNRYNAHNLKIDILNNDDFHTRMVGINTQHKNNFYTNMLAKNIENIRRDSTKGEEKEPIAEKLNMVISKFENAFSMSIIDIWKEETNEWSKNDMDTYTTLCQNGILSAIDNLTNNIVKRDTSIEYFKSVSTHDVCLAIEYFYKTNDIKAFEKMFYSIYRERRNNETLRLQNTTPDEHKIYLEHVGEMAIISSINAFNYFFFNLLINQSDFVKEVYTPEEIQELYHTGLLLAEELDDGGYYSSYYFRKSVVKNELKTLYMTAEEKERIRQEELRKKEEEERLRAEQKDASTKTIIEKIMTEYSNEYETFMISDYGMYKKVYRELDYEARKTKSFKEFRKLMLSTATCFEQEVGDFFEVIGDLVDSKEFTFKEGQAIIAKLSLIEETNETEKIA